MKKDILVLFKTHLDIGFTDYSANILKQYLTDYIPNAIRVGNELKGTDTPFIWTVGSWLIHEALKCDTDGSVDRAIRDGILTWHALPFTTHTELMNRELFQAGLDLSRGLDRRYGRKTIGAKMTDVPGHTRAMIPLLAENGVTFLHIGVNPATPLPPVPPVFHWKNGNDSVLVMYQADYGEMAEFDDFVICFAHTNDNKGPQSAEEIRKIYRELEARFPGCNVKASTLDEAAQRLSRVGNLPVLEKEIGDTWIHGAGTDPGKVRRYRRLLRELKKMSCPSSSVAGQAAAGEGCIGSSAGRQSFGPEVDLADHLLLIPEHTWGMDVKTHFPNDQAYTPEQLEQCAAERAKIEASWAEQRRYAEDAEKALGLDPEEPVTEPDISEGSGWVRIGASVGTDFELSWQIFDRSDYRRYEETYLRSHVGWAIRDFTKVGLPEYQGGIYTASVTEAYEKDGVRLYRLELKESVGDGALGVGTISCARTAESAGTADGSAAAGCAGQNAAEVYGLPYFWVLESDEMLEVRWFGKKASRLPQACWLKFKGLQEDWEVSKLGEWIDVEDIIGSPLILAMDQGVRNADTLLEPLDSVLAAPFGRRLLQYRVEEMTQDLHFNLYNNIWNTNFPLWYADDEVFRFRRSRR